MSYIEVSAVSVRDFYAIEHADVGGCDPGIATVAEAVSPIDVGTIAVISTRAVNGAN